MYSHKKELNRVIDCVKQNNFLNVQSFMKNKISIKKLFKKNCPLDFSSGKSQLLGN